MLEEIGMSLPEAIKAYPQCCGETADGNITFDGHSISNIDKMRKKDVIVFRMNCAELKNRYAGTKGVLSDKKISFERAFESKNYRKMIVLAEKYIRSAADFVRRTIAIYSFVPMPKAHRPNEQNNAERLWFPCRSSCP